MNDLLAMIWVEGKKAIRSRMPLWTAIGSQFFPLGIAFLVFVSKNPDLSKKLGLIGAKANLIPYASMDWATYLGMSAQLIGAGGFMLYVLIISWVFGREFADGTLKDLLAVPVRRANILAAKFIVTAVWSAVLSLAIYLTGLILGYALKLPGGAPEVIWQNTSLVLVTACFTIAAVLPYAFFAGVGRGYLLPIAAAILTLMAANLAVVVGLAEYYPWAVAGLYAQQKGVLPAVSYLVLFGTSAAGVLATFLWWTYADQNR